MREGGLAGRSKVPREEIALKECHEYVTVSSGNRGVEYEEDALYVNIPRK